MIITTGRRLVFVIAAVATALLLALPFTASAQDRVALVVGNGAYAHALKLPNPPNDAADMTAALRDLGFEVISATDADKSAFDSALRDFAKRLRGARTALFYYAGHGLQVAGKNYAVPTDARLEAAADLPVETVDIDQVLSVMQADEARVNLVFLDACRDNPLSRSFARALPATRSASVGMGLSAVNAGRGTLIAYATAPNQVALDGARTRNSPFTAALLRHIGTPGLDIALIMRRVTADVEAASGGAQSPWVHASLTTDVVLKGGSGNGSPRVAVVTPEPVRPPPPTAKLPAPNLPMPTAKLPAPNLPMPADIAISQDVLQVVETHPFFANAPAVRVGGYSIDTSYTSTGSGQASFFTSASEEVIQWLRRGVAKETLNQNSTSGGMQSTTQTTNVRAGNGLISLGSRSVTRSKVGISTVLNKTVRLENLSGSIFPLHVGKRFSYDVVGGYNVTAAGTRHADESVTKYTCEVLKKLEASSFHPNLAGAAHLVHCDYQIEYKRNKTSNSRTQYRSIYFEQLGYWVMADPVAPRESLVLNGSVFVQGAQTVTMAGTYTLKSFSLAR